MKTNKNFTEMEEKNRITELLENAHQEGMEKNIPMVLISVEGKGCYCRLAGKLGAQAMMLISLFEKDDNLFSVLPTILYGVLKTRKDESNSTLLSIVEHPDILQKGLEICVDALEKALRGGGAPETEDTHDEIENANNQ